MSKSILFSPAMALAVREGRKTVTRRIIKPQPPAEATSCGAFLGGEMHGSGAWDRNDWVMRIEFRKIAF